MERERVRKREVSKCPTQLSSSGIKVLNAL